MDVTRVDSFGGDGKHASPQRLVLREQLIKQVAAHRVTLRKSRDTRS